MKNKLMAAVLAATALSALPAQAQDTVSTTVNARAGLSPVLSLACDRVNFGVHRVPIRATGGVTTISLAVSANNASGATTATTGGNTTNVAAASGFEVPAAAICTVNGSNNVSSTIQSAISQNTGLNFGASNHNNLNNPAQVAALTADLSLAGAGVTINSVGAGTFRVTGVLTIPEVITAENYGGYSTVTAENSATVTVTDALAI